MIGFGLDLINESGGDNPLDAEIVIQEGKFGDFVRDVKDIAVDTADKKLGVNTDQIKKEWEKKPVRDANGSISATNVIDRIGIAGNATGAVAGALDDQLDNIKDHNEVDGKSIIARSRNSIKQNPVYITQTIRANPAHLLGKLFEKVYATFLQAALSQNPYITPDEVNGLKFLDKFHTDIRESAKVLVNEYYQPIDDFDAMMQESIYNEYQLSGNCTVQFSVIPSNLVPELVAENARLMNEPLTGIPYLYTEANPYYTSPPADKKYGATSSPEMKNSTEIIRVDEKDLEELAKHRLPQDDVKLISKSIAEIDAEIDAANPMPPKPNTTDKGKINRYNDKCQIVGTTRNRRKEVAHREREQAVNRLHVAVDEVKDDIKQGKFDNPANNYLKYDAGTQTYYRKKTSSTKNSEKPINIDMPEFLRQTDIKKINGMDPYMMKATFIVRDPATQSNTEISFVIGIKSVMHLIYVQDLADELYELVTGNIKSLQKVRYKTGEIKWSDYVFNTKGLKADAAKGINYNKRWISTLKNLANFNKTRGSLLKKPVDLIAGNVPIPNATLVLTQTDVTWLVNKTGIDLSQISNARKLANSLFLIAIAIVDESAGSMRVFYPDRDTDWDVQSLASVDAEVSKTDNSNLMSELKKAINR